MASKLDAKVKAILERWDEAESHDRINRKNALEDAEFRVGNQWPPIIKKEREDLGRPVLTVNRMAQFIRQIAGDVRLNKPAIKVRAVDSGADRNTARVLEGLIRNIEDQSRAPWVYALAADNAACSGIGHWRLLTEYTTDDGFEQDVRIEGIPNALAVVWDPQAIKPDRSDARYAFIYSMMSKDEFKKAYPKAAEIDFQVNDQNSDIRLSRDWYQGDRVRIAEYWCKEETKKTLLKLSDGRVICEQDYGDDVGPPIEEVMQGATVKKRREVVSHTVQSYVVSGQEILSGPHDWAGKYIPIIPTLGEEVYVGERVERAGIIRDAKDSQRLLNYYRSASAETVALQPRAPWLVTPGMIASYRNVWDNANKTNPPYLPWTPDPQAPGAAPQRIAPPAPAIGLMQEASIAADDLKATTGIFDAALGARSNETSGVAIESRQEQTDVATYLWKDNLNFAIATTGIYLIDLIQKIYDTERVVRVLGDDGTYDHTTVNKSMMNQQGKVIKYDLTVGKYDVTVDTGPSFSTRRKEAGAGMIQFVQAVPAAAPLMGDLLAKTQDWPNSEEVAERLQTLLPPQMQPPKVDEQGNPLPPPEPPPDPNMVALQGKQQLAEQQMLHEKEMAEQKHQLAIAEAQRAAEIAEQKAEREAELEAYKADNEIALKTWIAENEMAIEVWKAEMDASVEDSRVQREAGRELKTNAPTIQVMADALKAIQAKMLAPPKRKIVRTWRDPVTDELHGESREVPAEAPTQERQEGAPTIDAVANALNEVQARMAEPPPVNKFRAWRDPVTDQLHGEVVEIPAESQEQQEAV